MSKSPKVSKEIKLSEECYTIAPLHEHSFLNKKKEFDIKLLILYCAQKGIKPPDHISSFEDLHAKASQTVQLININISTSKSFIKKSKFKSPKRIKK
jgi:hypothetical protein